MPLDGEEHAGARHRTTFLADLFESIVAVIYLDQGLPAVTEFLLRHFQPSVLRASVIGQQRRFALAALFGE